ncbi:MAG TPA: hypothetical protein VFJ45_12175, partial [bacterium]|nr:hypothetical protein [bacterium]
FHSDDWVYVRYTYATGDGRRLHPLAVRLRDGTQVRGFPVFRWLENQAGAHADAAVHGLDLDNREVTIPVTDLDFSAPLEAYAYTSEKIFYLRTNLVENFPLSAMQMLRSKMENVPDVAPEFLRQNEAMLHDLVDAIRRDGGEVTEFFAGQSRDEVTRLLARMIAFDNARAMLDISKVLPVERVFTNPMEPTRLATVVLLRRDREDATVVERLSLPAFMSALLIGETPDKKREIAYNAYRAVDDEEEKVYILGLESEARGRDLYRLFERKPDVPATLREEFELFRVMHRACRAYVLNTTLTADPAVKDRKAAVALTMQLIASLVDRQPQDLRLTLADYRGFLAEPPERTAVSPA